MGTIISFAVLAFVTVSGVISPAGNVVYHGGGERGTITQTVMLNGTTWISVA